ncbi:hypothetical protein RRF57_008213 [Xylaria bambusicola]|uniref:Uncharacterized protein n=1 Tax=Xylaria bambusicola TaxID=326684 RepID=A0AAN7URQ4_9PEZI
MEVIKTTFSRLSLKSLPRIRPNQQYADDESREYAEDEQRQGFLKSKEEGEPVEFGNPSASTTNRPYSMSIYRVVGVVVAAVVLTAAASLFFARSSVPHPTKVGNYQDVSEHATEVLTELVAHAKPPQFRMKSPCGSTPEEAKARGCHFDTISFCWLPSECYDRKLVDSFEATRNWHYYADPEVSIEDCLPPF